MLIIFLLGLLFLGWVCLHEGVWAGGDEKQASFRGERERSKRERVRRGKKEVEEENEKDKDETEK